MRARVRMLGRSVGLLVGRLVLATLARRIPEPVDPAPAPWRMPRELTTTPADVSPAELLRRLRTDRGCIGPAPRRHLACRAARELVRSGAREPAVLGALEETVTAAARPACVREAAVEALVAWAGPEADRALRRMHAVARRRLAWDGGDRALAARLAEITGRVPARRT